MKIPGMQNVLFSGGGNDSKMKYINERESRRRRKIERTSHPQVELEPKGGWGY